MVYVTFGAVRGRFGCISWVLKWILLGRSGRFFLAFSLRSRGDLGCLGAFFGGFGARLGRLRGASWPLRVVKTPTRIQIAQNKRKRHPIDYPLRILLHMLVSISKSTSTRMSTSLSVSTQLERRASASLAGKTEFGTRSPRGEAPMSASFRGQSGRCHEVPPRRSAEVGGCGGLPRGCHEVLRGGAPRFGVPSGAKRA